MKSIFKQLTALLLVICLACSFVACNTPDNTGDGDGKDDGGNTPKKEEITEATAFLTVDINPSIEATVDIDGTVVSIYGANEDGQILLYGEGDNIIGFNYEYAVEYITDLAIELGYLNEDTGSVNVSCVADDATFASELQSKISSMIKTVATDDGITVAVDTSDPFSLLCELNELKEKYPDNVKLQSLTATEYKLALTLSEREDISIVAAIEYDSDQIIKRISDAHATLENYATEAYVKDKAQAAKIYHNAMGILIDGVYNEVYMANLMSHIDTYYYGAIYQAYKTTARTYRSIYEIKLFADSMANYEVDEAIVAQIAEELGLSDTTPLQNDEGKVTVESLIAFSDEFIRTHEVTEEIKTAIADIIADAKVARELANKGTTEAYSTDIQALKTQIGTIISTINASYAQASFVMSETAKAECEACLADLAKVEATLVQIIEGGITSDEIESLANEADSKAEDMLTKIKDDLSDAELELVNNRIEALKTQQEKLTEEFKSRLAAAETQAKEYINAKREERKNTNSDN